MPKLPPALTSRYTLALALAASLALAACSKTQAPLEPVRAVKVMTVGVDTFKSGYEFAGEVRPRVESRLGFRVAGKIIKRQAELGQHVKAGEVLAQLDPQDYQLAADAARAQVAAATTNRDLAAADFKRYPTLRDQNFISGAELERRETTLKAAQAQLEQAQAQLASQGNQAALHQPGGRRVRRHHRRRGRAGPGGDRRHAGRAHRPGRAARRGVLGARRQGRRRSSRARAVAVRGWAGGSGSSTARCAKSRPAPTR